MHNYQIDLVTCVFWWIIILVLVWGRDSREVVIIVITGQVNKSLLPGQVVSLGGLCCFLGEVLVPCHKNVINQFCRSQRPR
jgi:hypothetical protein